MPHLVDTAHTPTPPAQDDFDLRQLIEPLLKYKWLILAVTCLVGALAYFWTLKRPRIFEADCTLQYDPNPARPLGRDIEDVTSQPMYFWVSREYYETQNKLIGSRAIAERVARSLALHQHAEFMGVPKDQRSSWKGATVVDAARRVQGQLAVRQDKDTRIVHVLYKDEDPKRAALVANAIADAYIAKTMEDRLSSSTSALEWLAEQLDTLKDQLESAELNLHQFTKEHKELNVPIDDQKEIVAADIHRLSEALGDARTRRIELEARLEALKQSDREDPFEVHASAITDNVTVSKLRESYAAAAAERDELATHYGAQHPTMAALTARIGTLRQQVRHEIDGLISTAQSDLNAARTVETKLANALARANDAGLRLSLREIEYRRLERERDNTSKLYGTILQRTAETDLTRALEVAFVRLIDRATVPSQPISPNVPLNLVIGTALGLLLGMGLAVLLSRLDRVIRTVEAAEGLGLTILGVMPSISDGPGSRGPSYSYNRKKRKSANAKIDNPDIVVHTHPQSSIAECCRTIRTNLTFMSADAQQKALLITSPNPREGKTTVSISLAIAIAQSGKRVLIVDTDLRKPRIHRALGGHSRTGVTGVLVGTYDINSAVQETEVPGLSMLPAGPIPPNPSELLHGASFQRLVRSLSDRFDHVIFDSPPLNVVTDASVIAPQVDGTLIVLHSQRTTRDAAKSALRMLRGVSATVTGGVLNQVDLSARQYGYGSYYYYSKGGYYASDPDEHEEQSNIPAAE